MAAGEGGGRRLGTRLVRYPFSASCSRPEPSGFEAGRNGTILSTSLLSGPARLLAPRLARNSRNGHVKTGNLQCAQGLRFVGNPRQNHGDG